MAITGIAVTSEAARRMAIGSISMVRGFMSFGPPTRTLNSTTPEAGHQELSIATLASASAK